MALMDESAWQGKVFLGGWTAGGGGDAPLAENYCGYPPLRGGFLS